MKFKFKRDKNFEKLFKKILGYYTDINDASNAHNAHRDFVQNLTENLRKYNLGIF